MRAQNLSADRLVNAYLLRLERALRDLPADRRREIVDDVREHITAARAELAYGGEAAAIRAMLARLGDPAEIARAAGVESIRRARPGLLEIGAMILLPVGGILGLIVGWMLGALIPLPVGKILCSVLGWLLGVACLWASDRWTWRDKLIGTLLLPGGVLGLLVLAQMPAQVTRCAGLSGHNACTSTGWSLSPLVGIPLFVLLLVLPFASAGYLDWRLRRPLTGLLAA